MEVICIPNINTIPCTDKKLPARLNFSDRCTDKTKEGLDKQTVRQTDQTEYALEQNDKKINSKNVKMISY